MELDELNASSSGFIHSFDLCYPTNILKTLLSDRTTGHNIIWADNEYEALGNGYMGDDEITVEKITGLYSGIIKPRIAKEEEHQLQRTKARAEVFTPSWLVNRMNNDLDDTWFGVRDVFNIEDGNSWQTKQEPVVFPRRKGFGWHAYVESPRLEITCGEAPFVCSRYDTVTGDALPVAERIGFLDRKLRVVSEKTKSRKEWMRWALAALKASYGYEYQGDNLLIARINVFETFCEHLRERWGAGIKDEELDQAARIVSWNFWQMNGFTCAVPTNKMDATTQSTLFGYEEPAPGFWQSDLLDELPFEDVAEEEKEEEPSEMVPLCVIYDWQENEPVEFHAMKGKARPMDKKFYAVIGNPPYQEEVEGTSDKPIFNYFMDAAYEVGEKVELITPARFLFNAGKTPKVWNRRVLNDPHLTVLDYEQSSSKVFANTDIKGGVAITFRDATREVGPIGVFSSFSELRSIQKKVVRFLIDGSLDQIMFLQNKFILQELYADYPDVKEKISSDGKERRIVTSSFSKLPCFTENQTSDDAVRILGLGKSNRRIYKWIERKYIENNGNLDSYKVIVPKANGSGAIGEVVSTPLVGEPLVGYTQSFIGIGSVSTKSEAEAILKYVKSKFARTMLGILKITQDNPPDKWKFVPLQDFTSASDIDWTKSVSKIDQQLYAKYGLTDEEIDFIESHVKEMG